MGEFSVWHWMIVLMVVLLVFGGSRVSSVMGDVAKGIREFKKNLAEPPEEADDARSDEQPKQLAAKRRTSETNDPDKAIDREKASARRA